MSLYWHVTSLTLSARSVFLTCVSRRISWRRHHDSVIHSIEKHTRSSKACMSTLKMVGSRVARDSVKVQLGQRSPFKAMLNRKDGCSIEQSAGARAFAALKNQSAVQCFHVQGADDEGCGRPGTSLCSFATHCQCHRRKTKASRPSSAKSVEMSQSGWSRHRRMVNLHLRAQFVRVSRLLFASLQFASLQEALHGRCCERALPFFWNPSFCGLYTWTSHEEVGGKRTKYQT